MGSFFNHIKDIDKEDITKSEVVNEKSSKVKKECGSRVSGYQKGVKKSWTNPYFRLQQWERYRNKQQEIKVSKKN